MNLVKVLIKTGSSSVVLASMGSTMEVRDELVKTFQFTPNVYVAVGEEPVVNNKAESRIAVVEMTYSVKKHWYSRNRTALRVVKEVCRESELDDVIERLKNTARKDKATGVSSIKTTTAGIRHSERKDWYNEKVY